MPKVAPSVLAADFSHLADDVSSAEQAGVSMLHLDIMDGHFVPNISFGPGIVKTINEITDLFLDVHLMLSQPEKYFDQFVKAGADAITFHLEVHPEPAPQAARLRALGVKTGISINPDMPVERVLRYLEDFDFLLLMSVFPGFGGQGFIDSVKQKISVARQHVDRHQLDTRIMVDGGIDAGNVREVVAAGADILVMGTGFFGSADRRQLVESVESLSNANRVP
ncbi:MAG TPA: ribulose-phosphate 3-epimerase [Acidobacteriota bacterium]|nr:ribulose-phosphate 3-epimerase [Acidobacteriota bacterium]